MEIQSDAEMRLIQEKASAESAALKRSQEIKTEAENIRSQASTEAARLREIAQAKRDAALLEAEGQKALAEAQIKLYQNPQVLQLEMMKLWVQGCEALAKQQQPALLLQGGGGGGSGGMGGAGAGDTGGLLEVFRHQGRSLLNAAMGRGAMEKGAMMGPSGGDAHPPAPSRQAAQVSKPPGRGGSRAGKQSAAAPAVLMHPNLEDAYGGKDNGQEF